MIRLPLTLDWSKYRRTRAARLVASAAPSKKPKVSGCIDFNFADRDFTFRSRDSVDMVARAMQAGTYEAPLPIMVMAAMTRSHGLFLDIGANNGLYSILAAKTRPDAKVVAFEPYSLARDVLLENLAVNGVEHKVVVHDLALSDSAGEARLHIPDSSHGFLETSATLEPDFKATVQSVSVFKARLDDILLDGRIAVMKIDVEGHEAAVLRGAAGRLEQDRPIVFAEMLPGAKAHFAIMTELFTKLDYLLFRLRPDCAIRADVIRFDPLAWNYACVPPASLAVFRDCCMTHGLEILAPA